MITSCKDTSRRHILQRCVKMIHLAKTCRDDDILQRHVETTHLAKMRQDDNILQRHVETTHLAKMRQDDNILQRHIKTTHLAKIHQGDIPNKNESAWYISQGGVSMVHLGKEHWCDTPHKEVSAWYAWRAGISAMLSYNVLADCQWLSNKKIYLVNSNHQVCLYIIASSTAFHSVPASPLASPSTCEGHSPLLQCVPELHS